MEFFKEKNIVKSLVLLMISDLICFLLTRFYILPYDKENIYHFGINIVQILYILPTFVVCMFYLACPKSDKTLLITSTLGLILYSIILHFGMVSIASLFTNTTGIIHFVEYSAKIYCIALPLISFRILIIKKTENRKILYFWILLRIILLFVITIVFNKLFLLKGVLYSWSLTEFVIFLLIQINFFRKKWRKMTNVVKICRYLL